MGPLPHVPTAVLAVEAAGALEQALLWLRGGEVVAFPTDTVYGLGAALDDVAAIARLFEVKERSRHQGIPLLLAEVRDVQRVCRDVPQEAWLLAERFWPGGLSLVLWRRPVVPSLVTGGRPTVAVRLPAHPWPQKLARSLQLPLVVTSANRSGAPAPKTAAEVQAHLGGCIPLILDGGTCPGGRPSTIVDLTVDPPALLRAGPISRGELEAALERPLADR